MASTNRRGFSTRRTRLASPGMKRKGCGVSALAPIGINSKPARRSERMPAPVVANSSRAGARILLWNCRRSFSPGSFVLDDFIEFRKDIDWQARCFDVLGDLLHRRKADVRHLLLADLEVLGNVAVGPAAAEQQFHHLEALEFGVVAPFLDELAQGAGYGGLLELALFGAAGGARSGSLPGIQLMIEQIVAGLAV